MKEINRLSTIYLTNDISRMVRTRTNGIPTAAAAIHVHACRPIDIPAAATSFERLSPARIIYSVGVEKSRNCEKTPPMTRPGEPKASLPISENPESRLDLALQTRM